MDGSWHVIKWVWVAICFIWIVVQIAALRRLKGRPKRRSVNVFWIVFVPMIVSDWIRDVFENPEAARVSMLVVGVVAVIATVLLVRLLLTKAGDVEDLRERNPGGSIESLNLS